MTDNQEKLIRLVGKEINSALQSLNDEKRFPSSSSADIMDDRIKFFDQRVNSLRQVRSLLEEEFTQSGP